MWPPCLPSRNRKPASCGVNLLALQGGPGLEELRARPAPCGQRPSARGCPAGSQTRQAASLSLGNCSRPGSEPLHTCG